MSSELDSVGESDDMEVRGSHCCPVNLISDSKKALISRGDREVWRVIDMEVRPVLLKCY